MRYLLICMLSCWTGLSLCAQEMTVDDAFDGTMRAAQYGSDSLFNLLVWSDEFDQDGPIDGQKWHHQTRLPNGVSWYNNELQHYTDRLENSYVEDGHLYVVARRETFTNQGQTKNFTSARLNSKMAFTYGRVEVRAKLPTGAGTWPAIWMLGKNISEPGGYWYPQFGTTSWPACGEIDIMEHWGANQNYVSSALHTPCSFGNTVNVRGLVDNNVSDTFHVYAVEWYPDRMEFSLDGEVYYTYQPDTLDACTWPFDADQYLLLNVAMVGAVAPAFSASAMVIDYVRVYQEGTSASADPMTAGEWAVFPNPSSGAFRLELPPGTSDYTVSITDLAGRQRYLARYPLQPALDLAPELGPGLYFVSVYTAGKQTTKKLVIY